MRASVLILTLTLAFQPCVGQASDNHKHHHSAEKRNAEIQPGLKGESLYNTNSEWRDIAGQPIPLASFRGQKIILTMAYTYCTYTCPMVIAKLKKIEADLAAKGFADYKIVLASFDPARDTPKRLATYMKEKNLSASRWAWLSPKSDKDVRELAALLGIIYSRDKKGEYSHSNLISFLDPEGVVRERLNGIGADHQQFVASVVGKTDGH